MNLARRTVALAAMVAASLAAAPAGRAQLTSLSPFLPAGAGSAETVRQETLELRGILCQSKDVYFCIYDAAKKKSIGWLGLNEPGYGLVVRSYDAANDAVMVETPDGNKQLKLPKATVVPAGGPSAAAATKPTNSANPVSGGAETITPEERQARIRANFIAERERQMAQDRATNAQRTSAAAAPQ
jgi:hypothetical protein